jgi:transporter family-2 protein
MNSSFFYALIMLIAGLGIPVMAALNGGLGVKLQSPVLAASILLAVGFGISLLVLFSSGGVPEALSVGASQSPWYFWCGGIFVIFYILSITWIAPKFGVANAVSFVLLGQLIAMSLIDHFGLLGAPQYVMGIQRIIGLLLMAVGVLMVVNKPAVVS